VRDLYLPPGAGLADAELINDSHWERAKEDPDQ